MVFRKYRHIKGKKYGPYLYENKRVNGRIVTRYIGKGEKNTNWIIILLSLSGLFALLFLSGLLNSGFTGKASLSIQDTYKIGEPISGKLKLNLAPGELIPKDSELFVSLAGQRYRTNISNLISGFSASGDYYAEGVSLQGSGEGFGVMGQKAYYPEIEFEVTISKSEVEKGEVIIDEDEKAENNESDEEKSDASIIPLPNTGNESQVNEKNNNEGVGTGKENEETEAEKGKNGGAEANAEEAGKENEEKIGKPEVDIEEKDIGDIKAENAEFGKGEEKKEENTESKKGEEVIENTGENVNSGTSPASVTGGAIGEMEYSIKGKASKGNEFKYNLEEVLCCMINATPYL